MSLADIKKLEGPMKAAADGPVSEDLTLIQRLEQRANKIGDCRRQADAKRFGPLERIESVRECSK